MSKESLLPDMESDLGPEINPFSNVPREMAQAIDNLQQRIVEFDSRQMSFIIFGQFFSPGEAKFVLTYSNECAWEKINDVKGNEDQHSYEEYWKAIGQREMVQEDLLNGVSDELEFFVEEFFTHPQNILRVGMMALKGPNPAV